MARRSYSDRSGGATLRTVLVNERTAMGDAPVLKKIPSHKVLKIASDMTVLILGTEDRQHYDREFELGLL